MSANTVIYGDDEVKVAVDFLLGHARQCQVFAFSGSLGAGKTTLIQQILRKEGVEGVITSPTFTYVNMYKNNQGMTFFHFDCYRIATLDDFVDAGFAEYIYQPNSISFIEWPEVITPLLTNNVCFVSIDYYGDNKRILTYHMSNSAIHNSEELK